MNPEFEDYKFHNVYEFAEIISGMVDYETGFWNYDKQQFIDAVRKYNKISLLHIYIYTQLLNYYDKEYSKNGDCFDQDEYDKWIEIGNDYGIQFKTKLKGDFYKWYKKNEVVFEELFQYITDEVFFILFANHSFLVKFNKIVADEIKDEDRIAGWTFPKEMMNEDGTVKRTRIPQWAKNAVFHRDHGRCVFCGQDLTKVYTHSNAVNFDHIIPLHKYGANDPCNLQTTCEHCNKSKNDREDNPQYKYEPWW